MKKYLALPLLALLLPGACYSPEQRFADNQAKQMNKEMRDQQIATVAGIKRDIDKKFRDMTDPRSSVNRVRNFALQRLHDVTDEEQKIISEQLPVIGKKYDESEYSFTWKNPGHKSIEVVTSPPPCEPIAVYRVNRVFYP